MAERNTEVGDASAPGETSRQTFQLGSRYPAAESAIHHRQCTGKVGSAGDVRDCSRHRRHPERTHLHDVLVEQLSAVQVDRFSAFSTPVHYEVDLPVVASERVHLCRTAAD